jgi:hypothetical protein
MAQGLVFLHPVSNVTFSGIVILYITAYTMTFKGNATMYSIYPAPVHLCKKIMTPL